ncbi:RagB/SusD family nutrient uptake outer membrane protein [uncultured Dokdonia sp.]|uniref:RagB/SusD family nutrient uptake outer membrane protein n=1 Tax=uncultured Dokdonia sp. TaxID=575653 RepID=UPI00261E9262|nr:RagB/SusD family nutrient uptake outer membrane protein [uncultured Dokdonia sp.]
MKRNKIFKNLPKVLLGVFALVSVISCTDLEVEGVDGLIIDPNDSRFQGVTDPASFIGNSYNSLNGLIGDQANTFALSEVTTDAHLIPTRGADWGDNGIWRQLHQHNWTPEHSFITNVWNQWNTLHFQGAQLLSPLTTLTGEQAGDAHFLRALGMWVILDNFGQVPVRDPELDIFVDPIVLRGQEAVDQIVSDLDAAIANLSAGGPGSGNSRANKAAARYLLAKVLLNKHIYLGTSPDSADMNRVVSLVNDIEGEGYGLVSGYFDIFREQLDNETIWFIPTGVGNRIWNGLHYNMAPEIAGGGWNGFSTLAEYYDLFEGDPNTNVPGSGQEERRGFVPTAGVPFTGDAGTTESGNFPGFEAGSNIGFGFLIGQQYEIDGSPLSERGGAPLAFERDFVDGNGASSLINNSEVTGIRMLKYNPRYGGFTGHEIFFRFSDAHLMRAEAMLRSGGDATSEVNELRILRGAAPLGAVTEQDLLDERGRELYAEFWRRNDLVRFGQFTRDWELKSPDAVGDTNLNLFPIPASQVILNPNLTQNPGY